VFTCVDVDVNGCCGKRWDAVVGTSQDNDRRADVPVPVAVWSSGCRGPPAACTTCRWTVVLTMVLHGIPTSGFHAGTTAPTPARPRPSSVPPPVDPGTASGRGPRWWKLHRGSGRPSVGSTSVSPAVGTEGWMLWRNSTWLLVRSSPVVDVLQINIQLHERDSKLSQGTLNFKKLLITPLNWFRCNLLHT